jgi:hypothetical protein
MKPDKKSWTVVAAFTFVIQLIIISYNHFTEFVVLDGFTELMSRLIIGTALSLLVTIPALYINSGLVRVLSSKFPWDRYFAKRLIAELAGAIAIAALLSAILTLIAHAINPYEDGLRANIINNFLIFAVANIIYVAVIEAYVFFRDWKTESMRVQMLEKENAIARFENLKAQINPHFLFNSLNTLSNLVYTDSDLADEYIQEFSRIYRYILDNLDRTVVNLADELDFARSYLFLQRIRYGKSLENEIDIEAEYLDYFVPAMSLQLLLENCVKHNAITNGRPLTIEIFAAEDYLVVRNNYQKKDIPGGSTGIGLANLRRRYEYLSGREPVFKIDGNHYIAKIPLIKPE